MWKTSHVQFSSVLLTASVFLITLAANEWIFANSEFVRGINWIYLPAGVRLVCTLLFGISGAIGLLIASWLACFIYFFPDDFIRALAGGPIAAAAPYVAYHLSRQLLGFNADLAGMTAYRLVSCAVIYALCNSAFHHMWFVFHGDSGSWNEGLAVMFLGDLNGAIILLYLMKGLMVGAGVLARRGHLSKDRDLCDSRTD